jgi:ABC-2 type transport system ATP-binding protein
MIKNHRRPAPDSGYYPNLNLTELIELFAGLYNETVDPRTLLETVNLE